MIRLEIKKLQYNINREAENISTLSSGKIDKYQYLTDEEIFSCNKRQIIKQAKFAYSPLEKAFEKQIEKQIGAIQSLDLSNRLKQIEGIFTQNLMNDSIRAELKKIVKLQDIIKKNDLNYRSKRGKTYNFGGFSLPIVFLRDIHG